jgi:hypothetical protein
MPYEIVLHIQCHVFDLTIPQPLTVDAIVLVCQVEAWVVLEWVATDAGLVAW